MTEPAKDTAIDIAPKTQPTQGRVPKIVSEINRIASRVDGRKKRRMIIEFWKTTDLRKSRELYGRIHTIVGRSV